MNEHYQELDSTSRLEKNFRRIDAILEGKVSIYLDFIRGIAAILVVMEHISPMIFTYSSDSTLATKAIYLINLLGGPSVRIFFILSGLFISRSILKAIFNSNWSWKTYLISRFCRLYIVLFPALIITVLLDSLGIWFFSDNYYSVDRSLTTFLGNVFFVQGIIVPTFGTNHPLWSLSYEFWYYILFPLIALMIVRSTKITIKLLYSVFLIMCFIFIGSKISLSFFIWLMGTAILLLPIKDIFNKKYLIYICTVLFLLSLPLRPLVLTGKLFGGELNKLILIDTITGLTFVLFIYSLLVHHSKKTTVNATNSREKPSYFNRVSRLLASFSFSLYLIHQPILELFHGLVRELGYNGLKPSLISFTLEFALVFALIIIAFLFSRFTESKTLQLRKFVMGKLRKIPKYKQVA